MMQALLLQMWENHHFPQQEPPNDWQRRPLSLQDVYDERLAIIPVVEFRSFFHAHAGPTKGDLARRSASVSFFTFFSNNFHNDKKTLSSRRSQGTNHKVRGGSVLVRQAAVIVPW